MHKYFIYSNSFLSLCLLLTSPAIQAEQAPAPQAHQMSPTITSMQQVSATPLAADTTPNFTDDVNFFNAHLADFVKIVPTRIASATLDGVFAVPVYKVQIILQDGLSMSMVVARNNSSIIFIPSPSTESPLPQLLPLIKPTFILKSDADAKTFQDALDILYPISSLGFDNEASVKSFWHTPNQWTFVRGKFFEAFKGFIITTNVDGQITNIRYSLSIHPNSGSAEKII